jgi:hypothetical protein
VLEVWTSDHIDTIVQGKAEQSATRNPATGHRGLGWSRDAAQSLIDDLIYGLVERSGGDRVAQHVPDGNPPLDHEDGMVYGACRSLSTMDLLAHVYCVTRDRGFLQAYQEKSLSGHSRVITPSMFVGLVRRARMRYSMRKMT